MWALSDTGAETMPHPLIRYILYKLSLSKHPDSTRVDHEFMVQSRDRMLKSSSTTLARVYHNFVQIRALESKILHEIKFTKIHTLHRTIENSKDTFSI